MRRRERPEPPLRLLELALESGAISTACLVPRDDDVHEPLEEVLLLGLGRAPGVLERLVRGEVLPAPREVKAEVQIS